MQLQPYDFIMLAVLAGCTILGAAKGMASQVASITSLVASYFVALRFSDRLAPHLGKEAPLNRIAAMLVLYLATSLCIWIAFRFVKGFIERMKLKEFDRQVGGLFGAAKGVLLCVVITFFAIFLSAEARQAILKSRSGYYIAELIDRVDPLLPEEVHSRLGPYLHQLDEQLDPAHNPPAGHDSAGGGDRPAGGPGGEPSGGGLTDLLPGASEDPTAEALRQLEEAVRRQSGAGR